MIIGISGKQQSGKDFLGTLITNNSSLDWQVVKFADKVKDIVCMLIGCTRSQLEDIRFKNMPLGERWKVWKLEDSAIGTVIFTSEEEAKKYKDEWGYIREISSDIRSEILTPRKLLQLVGTEGGRKIIHPNVWINATLSSYDSTKNWIITDVRFANEADAIRNAGGVVIRIDRSLGERFPELMTQFMLRKYRNVDFFDWLKLHDPNMFSSLLHDSETGLDNYENFDYKIQNIGDEKELLEKISIILQNLNINEKTLT